MLLFCKICQQKEVVLWTVKTSIKPLGQVHYLRCMGIFVSDSELIDLSLSTSLWCLERALLVPFLKSVDHPQSINQVDDLVERQSECLLLLCKQYLGQFVKITKVFRKLSFKLFAIFDPCKASSEHFLEHICSAANFLVTLELRLLRLQLLQVLFFRVLFLFF